MRLSSRGSREARRLACVAEPPLLAAALQTRVVAAIIVILGIGYFAIFLALVVDGVQAKMEALKHGLSPVVERSAARTP